MPASDAPDPFHDLLSPVRIDADLFEVPNGTPVGGRVFGGQVVAQALQAAQATVEGGRPCHSLHAYFVRAGVSEHPIRLRVERDADGRSFSARRVVASQAGRVILTLSASFHDEESGFAHRPAMPDVPRPEDIDPGMDFAATAAGAPGRLAARIRKMPSPVEVRLCGDAILDPQRPRAALHQFWLRAVAPVPDVTMGRALLAYASDLMLLSTQALPHGIAWWDKRASTASLDHAIWFHEADVGIDDWLLYVCDSPWAGHARGLNRGQFFARDGRLVASVQQEGLLRFSSQESASAASATPRAAE